MIILISGPQHSGKTTLAESIDENLYARFDMKVIHHRFAGVIYEMHDECRMILQNYGIKVGSEKDGELLQFLGTEYGRKKYGNDVWCITTRAAVKKSLEKYPDSVNIISDCRFKNEFMSFPDALRIRLTCDRDVRKARNPITWRPDENHPSEIDLNDWADRFDLVFDTGKTSVQHCVELVIHEMQTKSYLGKRKHV